MDGSVLASLVKYGGAIGGANYVLLTFFYHRFYGELGIEPEDVGLSQTVMIGRAAAGAFTVLLFALLVSSIVIIPLWLLHRLDTAAQPSGRQGDPDLLVSSSLRSSSLPVLQRARRRLALSLRHVGFRRSVVVAIGGSLFVVFFALLWLSVERVDRAAQAARDGRTVTPLTFASVRWLDIESSPCDVHWLGDATEKPRLLSSPEIHCLGSGPDGTVLRIPAGTLRVPSSEVAVFYPQEPARGTG